ncbi:hypothetical protein AB0C06_30805 [Micromonospora inaquosa]|uniref:MobA/VirD2-like nuclease domain-containing protein n=1 Tax=Micromonospora inaquosa TaxID=2203716 RepID=A0A3N9WXV6_9ACTN|nr:hypothetical protein [Micromonospora inaquosa]RQX05705.1 hypothetical protein DLJ59_06800 [Micromonospora inaquosa]
MICRIRRRSARPLDLLRYLFGPGERGEHDNPRLVGAWARAAVGGVHELARSAQGFSVVRLSRLLDQPVAAAISPPRRPVWHCSVHNHPADPTLSDQQWGAIAAEFTAAVGLASPADDAGARWVAVRHGLDHIHIVATLVGQDGATVWTRNDYHRCQRLARDLERRLGLFQLGATSARNAA